MTGYFTLSCPTQSGNDEFVVDAHGNTEPPRRAPRLPQPAAEQVNDGALEQLTWLGHHDRLVAEWFDGERALVDDLYGPDSAPTGLRATTPRRARAPWGSRYPTLARWGSDLAEFGRVFIVVVLITAAVVWANWVLSIFGR